MRAANQIKQIEITLNKIQNFSEKSDDDLAFISIVVPELVNDGTFDALIKQNLQISDLKTRFKGNYIPLLKAEQKRSIMIEKNQE